VGVSREGLDRTSVFTGKAHGLEMTQSNSHLGHHTGCRHEIQPVLSPWMSLVCNMGGIRSGCQEVVKLD
jgi:hypothetical protein